MSRYDGSDTYVYPGTEVLRNLAGIQEQTVLDKFEADITAVRILEIINNPIAGAFDHQDTPCLYRRQVWGRNSRD